MPQKGPQLEQPHVPRVPPVPPSLSGPDACKTAKLAQRVEQTLKMNRKFEDPKQIDPREILVAPLNRDGAPPNVQHIHHGILKSFVEKGFRPEQASTGDPRGVQIP